MKVGTNLNTVKIAAMSRGDYHHGDLRRALLDAAERLVRREGAARASLRAIAREAGVSPSAPYHHFEDRESLLAAVAARGFRSLGSGMADARAADDSEGPLERMRVAGIAYVRFAIDNAEMFRLMFGGMLSDRTRFPELKQAADDAGAVLEGLVGGERVGGERHSAVALAAWSTVHGLAFLLVEGLLREEEAELGVEEITREVTQVLGRGLRAYGSPDGS